MSKFNPLNNFNHFNKIKPEGYVVFMTSETENKGLTIELAEPNDRVFEVEYKEHTITVTDNKNNRKIFINDVDETVTDLEEYTNKLINESLGEA